MFATWCVQSVVNQILTTVNRQIHTSSCFPSWWSILLHWHHPFSPCHIFYSRILLNLFRFWLFCCKIFLSVFFCLFICFYVWLGLNFLPVNALIHRCKHVSNIKKISGFFGEVFKSVRKLMMMTLLLLLLLLGLPKLMINLLINR